MRFGYNIAYTNNSGILSLDIIVITHIFKKNNQNFA